MQPTFAKEDSVHTCAFQPVISDSYEFDADDFFIANSHSKRKDDSSDIEKFDGKIVVFYLDKWTIENAVAHWDADADFSRLVIFCESEHNVAGRMPYPIDPAMKEKDINGATIIKPNASNNGWIFAHATKAEHIDRIWIASTAMSSIFDRVMEDKLQQTLASIINNPQTNQQRGVYLKWADMLDFKKDCTAYCVRFEKLLYLGQHKQQSGLNLRDMLLLCIKHVKQEWQKVEDKFDGVAGDVNGIIAALEADHDFETRWEQEARQKREAAARAAAESGTEDQ